MLRGYKPVLRGLVVVEEFSLSVFCCSACSPTCEQKQDSVVFAVGCLDPLDSQVAVGVFSRHHGQVPSNWSHTVICQEVLFDKAQGIVWGVVQATLTQKWTQTNYFCIHFHLCCTFLIAHYQQQRATLERIYYQATRQPVGFFIKAAKCYVAYSYMFQIWTALWNVKYSI